MSGVLCCGNAVFDVLVRAVDELRWNTTCWVEQIRHTMGGNGSNTAYALAVLGARVRLLAWVGSDPAGQTLLARLAAAGVDLTAVRRSQLPTATSVSLINRRGDRFLLHSPGASLEAFAGPPELTGEMLAGMTHFHLANLFAAPNLRRHGAEWLRCARAAGLITSLDTGWDQDGRWMLDLGPALPWVDLLFVNEEETLGLTGTADLEQAARVLAERGCREVVFKLGPRGCAVWSAGRLYSVPAFDVAATDTTGAGDCFAGAFLAATLRGLSRWEAARFANAAAALAVQQVGATEGLRSWEETEAWMQTARVRTHP